MAEFGSTEPFTMGVEEEFQVLDPETFDLVSRADEVLGKTDVPYEENLRTELFQAVVETASDVCQDIDEVREEIVRLRTGIAEELEDKGYRMGAAGTHPFALWEEQDHTDAERYRELISELQWPAKRELIFGQHVHVAVRNAGEAVYASNYLQPFLPLILALSANSPFWRGEDTGLKATRVRIFDAMPRTGLPPTFDNWTDYKQTVDRFMKAGSIDDLTKIWWDVRPRPDLGTVEVRMADLPTDPEVSVSLTAFVQALVVRLCKAREAGEAPPVEHGREVVEENRWQALRAGLDADLIQYANIDEIERLSVAEALERTMDHLGDVPGELGVKNELAQLVDLAERGQTGADRQIEAYEDTGDLKAVVEDIADRTVP